ncbi:MAG: hypothetical protein II807_04295, partial [Thermoguttaceae bacterium]|nr:hypothetical protein [Thermoguttaceae bacterium]
RNDSLRPGVAVCINDLVVLDYRRRQLHKVDDGALFSVFIFSPVAPLDFRSQIKTIGRAYKNKP